MFNPRRQWRFDFAWPFEKLAIEVQGFGPGHNSYKGMSNDYEKHNNAILLGWKILFFMAHDLDPKNVPNTVNTIRNTLGCPIKQPDPKAGHYEQDHINAARRTLDQIINKQNGL